MALGGTGGFLPKTPPPTSENQLFPGPGELGLTLSKWREQTLTPHPWPLVRHALLGNAAFPESNARTQGTYSPWQV
jgi:hypothetical protein